MTNDAPDYTKIVQLFGKYAGSLLPIAVDADGQLYGVLKGSDGTILRVVKVDTSGRLETVILGEYSGASKVLATDEDGRLIAIITDPENIWGVRPVVGNAELAVRLGSHTPYDRRGSVMHILDFSHGMTNVYPNTYGTGGACEITADYSKHGGYSLKIITPSNGDFLTEIQQYHCFPAAPDIVGIEFAVSEEDSAGSPYCYMSICTDTRRIYAGVLWDSATSKLYYMNGVGTWADSGFTRTFWHVADYGYEFHSVKLCFSTLTEKYVRVCVDHKELDWSAFSCPASDYTDQLPATTRLGALGANGQNYTFYFADLIHTIKEPE